MKRARALPEMGRHPATDTRTALRSPCRGRVGHGAVRSSLGYCFTVRSRGRAWLGALGAGKGSTRCTRLCCRDRDTFNGLQCAPRLAGVSVSLLPPFAPLPLLWGRLTPARSAAVGLLCSAVDHVPGSGLVGACRIRRIVTERGLWVCSAGGRWELLDLPGSTAPGRIVGIVTGPATSHVGRLGSATADRVWKERVLPWRLTTPQEYYSKPGNATPTCVRVTHVRARVGVARAAA